MRDGWIYKKLGEVCEIERGGSPRPITEFLTEDPKGINWIKIGDAEEGSKYITRTAEKIKPEGMKKSRFVHAGDFILSNSMSFGKPYILGIDGCIHDGWLVLHDKSNSFDKNYLYYVLSSQTLYAEFKRLAGGGVVNNLNSKLVKGVSVPIPPLTTQQQIVSELDLLSHILDQKRQQLKEYDALAESIFYDMFGDPVENPKGWEVKTIGDLCRDVKYGTSKPAVEGGQYPYLRMNNITSDGHLDLKDLKKIDIPDEEFEKCVVRYGDILFNRTNSLEHVGKTCMFDLAEPMIIAGYIIRVRLIDSAEPLFVAKFFNMPSTKKVLRKMAKGAVNQANINSKEMQTIPIPLPPLTLQRSFASKIESIEHQKQLLKESIKETEMLFQSRMDYWFNV